MEDDHFLPARAVHLFPAGDVPRSPVGGVSRQHHAFGALHGPSTLSAIGDHTMRTSTAGLVLLLFLGAPALAHHGLAAFDQATKVTVKGTVTAFRFVNPHAVVEFDVKDDAGQVQGWQAELTTPNRLKGWTATSLEPGVVVTVTGYRAKSGAPSLWVTALTASNGLELKVFSEASIRKQP
jgi:hypothetical protein